MVELVYLRYNDVLNYMSKHVEHLDELFEKLANMEYQIFKTPSVGILVTSIKVDYLIPVTESIKTFPEKDLKWV